MELVLWWVFLVSTVALYRAGIYTPLRPVRSQFHCESCKDRKRLFRFALFGLTAVAVFTHGEFPVHPDYAFLALTAVSELT